jgi:hypothetical protein
VWRLLFDKPADFLQSFGHMNATLLLKHSTNCAHWPLAVLIPLAFACFALAPMARADCREGCDLNRNNTFLGDNALIRNTTGRFNTATGAGALSNNTTGFGNTATGEDVLSSNTTGSVNTATGVSALANNTTGAENTATGADALENNTTGLNNTANGFKALQDNTTGAQNTAVGFRALHGNTTGARNIAIGFSAGSDLTTGSNNIDIGNFGFEDDSGKIRIGTSGRHKGTYIAGIRGITVPAGIPVIVAEDGQLGTMTSSARFKDEIKPMDKASEAILALKPIRFRYKKEMDRVGIQQFGLLAEDVEKVDPDLVVHDKEGKPYTVRYDQINAMLLNEFLKEHRTVQEQGATIARLQKQIEALTAGLQKVTAQLEVNRSAPPTVLAFESAALP